MAARRSASFAPTCLVFESRLAPSGNFLSHGLAAATHEAHRIGHAAQAAEKATVHGANHLRHDLTAHNHHIVAATTK